uniref:Ig-like domain-containing protein n=1 Tax=Fundulus heteroclitus TaxID=8078 RepID=A0A3Q2TIZ4_FUNHE
QEELSGPQYSPCLCVLTVFLQVSAVEMLEGESVQLSCDFPTFDVDQPTVLWTRSDLSPSTVYQLQLGGDQLKDQNQLYRGRTSMNTDALETGDLSLNLINLQLSDTGTYTCTVRTSRGEAKVTDIELLVKERFPSWAKVLLALLVLVLIVFGGLLFHFRHYFMSGESLKLHYP